MTADVEADATGTVFGVRQTPQGTEYDFADGATEWEREAVREYGVESKDEVEDALAWREAMDELETDNPKIARVFRGKHPSKVEKIGRPNRGPPDHANGSR